MNKKKFITYNLKIKGNNPYPILLIEVGLSPIESMTMFRYLMHKKKIYNMKSKRLPKFLLTLVKIPTFASSVGGIRMPGLGSTIGELRRR